jgi:DNA-binding NtrC family response regulator
MFITAAGRQIERANPPRLSQAAVAALQRYKWPGNVRELRNVIERAVALCVGSTIQPGDLPPGLLEAAGSSAASGVRPEPPSKAQKGSGDLASDIRALERARIVDMLERCGGSQTQAAKRLGISRGTLIARMQAFDLPRPRRRDNDAPVD